MSKSISFNPKLISISYVQENLKFEYNDSENDIILSSERNIDFPFLSNAINRFEESVNQEIRKANLSISKYGYIKFCENGRIIF